MINPIELNKDEKYFADTDYMSVSRYKRLDKCEFAGSLNTPTIVTEPMLVGSFVDAYISGTLDEFIKANPQIISSRGATKGQLKAQFKKAEEICQYIDNTPTFKQFMQGDKQTVMTGEIEGVPIKGKFDIYAKGIAVNDLKVMAKIRDNRGNYINFISDWGYDIQLAVYQELVYQNTGEKLPMFICVVTKEDTIDSAIINIPQEILDSKLDEFKSKVKRYYDIWKGEEQANGCGICNTCISKRIDVPIISMYDLMNLE